MNHQEIRFSILHYLYNKHYGEELGHYHSVEDIRNNPQLKDIDKHLVYGDVVYLQDKGLVDGVVSIGDTYPTPIKITAFGIDIVDEITNKLIQEMKDSNENQQEINPIINESNQKTKTEKVLEYVKANHAFFATYVEKLLRVFLGGASG